jgi:hypothetical protein
MGRLEIAARTQIRNQKSVGNLLMRYGPETEVVIFSLRRAPLALRLRSGQALGRAVAPRLLGSLPTVHPTDEDLSVGPRLRARGPASEHEASDAVSA